MTGQEAAATVASTASHIYTRRFSQEYNSQERESLSNAWFGTERPKVFSQPSEPDPRQFDVHWEAHERGLHPSQYSQEDDAPPSTQFLLTNADEDPVEEESDHEPYSQELISEEEEAERRGAVALVPEHRRCSAIGCNWAVATLARCGLFHKNTAELFKEVVPGSDVWACAREGHYDSARLKYLRAQVVASFPAAAARHVNDCTTCRNVSNHCYCSFCDGAPPIEGIDFGAALSYNVGHQTSRIGYYMGSIQQGSTYPADRDALTFAERAIAGSKLLPVSERIMTAAADGVFVSENALTEQRSGRPLFAPNSSVTLFAFLAREERERSAPVQFEPSWDEPNEARVAAMLKFWHELKYPSGVARGIGRQQRHSWPKGFRELVFHSRASADGETRCFCCGRVLGISKQACMQHNLQQHSPSDYIVPMELCHVEAHSLGGQDIWVNVWPGDSVCNGIMRANRFTHFAIGEWTPGHEPQDGSTHPISTPNSITTSREYLLAKSEFDAWFEDWDRDRAALKPDPLDMKLSVRK